jgi:tRNA nucleotidyltransferase (CCA-adding enzyme)
MSGSAAVAVRRTGYPQVEPRAAGLMHPRVVVVPAGLTVATAARRARERRARLVAVRIGRSWAGASRETLARALELGLAEAPVDTVVWDTAVIPPGAPEVNVRRQLGPDRPFVLVAGTREPQGVVFRDSASPGGLPLSLAPRLGVLPSAIQAPLRAAGALGGALGVPVAVVGGLVRDLLLGRVEERADLDLVVEGHAATLAHRLAADLSGRVVEHGAFLTATVFLPDGRRIDVATARRESYRAPGALPAVEPAGLLQDLARRDFSVNALAVRLDPGAWGRLLDVTGGLADLRGRRLRVLHPLSFVEDPTRILRAARLAGRLRCRIEPTTRRLAVRAAALDVYRALSADRIRAELELVLAEPNPVAVLREAARLGAWHLVSPGAVPSLRASRRLAAALAPRARADLSSDTVVALCLLALGEGDADRDPGASRLATPAIRESIRRARAEAPEVLARLARARGRAAAYTGLEGVPEATIAWARVLTERPAVRRHLDGYLRSWRRSRALATGNDLAALGVPAGPTVGALLRGLRAMQAAGKVRSRGGALRWLAGAVARSRDPGKPPLTQPGKGGG